MTEKSRRVPRWVLVFAIVLGAIVAAVAVTVLVVGGDHGPSRHIPPAHGRR
ncbi:MAG TPA: hypothetical protein VFT95_01240 [Micromonosporaceae bacterium]|nr:hypothetical protein [Micromonosporaceae bacterium]